LCRGAHHHKLCVGKFDTHDPTLLSSWTSGRSGLLTRTSPGSVKADGAVGSRAPLLCVTRRHQCFLSNEKPVVSAEKASQVEAGGPTVEIRVAGHQGRSSVHSICRSTRAMGLPPATASCLRPECANTGHSPPGSRTPPPLNYRQFRLPASLPASKPILPLLDSRSTRRVQKDRRPPFAPRASLRTCLRPRECSQPRPLFPAV
jgi:hypothetical protein